MAVAKVQILPLRRTLPQPSKTPHNNSGDGHTQTSAEDSIDGQCATGPKKNRASKPKVRTGCLTCKIRRVKCDETKPNCDRCTSTGRKCDGYNIPPRKKRRCLSARETSIPAPEKCLEVVSGTQDELRALEFFHERTAPGLSGYFDADFWTRLVFQMSSAEPCLRHAMVAVGTLHLQREHGTPTLPVQRRADARGHVFVPMPLVMYSQDYNNPFALEQYNKAIMHLAKRIQDPAAAVEIALLACILFVSLEFLRGEAEMALTHFKSGMGIIIQSLSNVGTKVAKSAMERIKDNMLPFFNRLELLSILFGNDAPWEYPVSLQYVVPKAFNNMKEARDSFVHLMNLSMRFIRYMKYRKYERIVLPDDVSRQQVLKGQIDNWKWAFDSLLLNDIHLTSRDLDAAKILRIHLCVTTIWLSDCIYAEESATDEFMDHFETAVSLGEALELSQAIQSEQYSTTFLFDMEIVSPLYFVALKCRHPQIRRRAIRLLRARIRREGLWDSTVAAAIAERIVAIEERNLSSCTGSNFPEERDRIHNSHIQSMGSEDPTKHAVTFYSKPNGIDGHWKIWQESIILDPPSNIRRKRRIDRYLLATGSGEAELGMATESEATLSPVPEGWDNCTIDPLPEAYRMNSDLTAGIVYAGNEGLPHAEERAKGIMRAGFGIC